MLLAEKVWPLNYLTIATICHTSPGVTDIIVWERHITFESINCHIGLENQLLVWKAVDRVSVSWNDEAQVWQLASTSLKIKEHSHKFVTNLLKNFGHPKKSWEKLRRGLFWTYSTSWIRIWSQFASKKSRSRDINVVVFGCPQLYSKLWLFVVNVDVAVVAMAWR